MGINARGQWDLASDAEDPGYANGFWYSMSDGFLQAGTALVANTIRFIPFRIRQLVNVVQIGTRITTLAAGGNIQFGIYAAQKDTLVPTGPVLGRSASQVTDAAGFFALPLLKADGTSVPVLQLPRGIYWFAVNADASAGGVAVLQALGASVLAMGALVGASSATVINNANSIGVFTRGIVATFGTWPDLTGSTAMSEGVVSSYGAGFFQVQT